MSSEIPSLSGEIRVAVVEDHPVFAHGLVSIVEQMPQVTTCEWFQTAALAREAMPRLNPNLVLLDIEMPKIGGTELLNGLLRADRTLRVLVISVHPPTPYALRALRGGARGYVQKTQPITDVETAVQTVIAGGLYLPPACKGDPIFDALYEPQSVLRAALQSLSARETEIFRLGGQGHTNKKVADLLQLSVKTVETHRAHIKEKLGFPDGDSLTEFATLWVQEHEAPAADAGV